MSALSLGAAAILGGSSFLSGLLGSQSTQSTNQQNYKQFRESMDYDRWKFNQEMRYNSIQSQVRQMRAAGLNPALTGQGAAQSVSAGGAPSANPMQPVDYSSFVNAGASVVDSLFGAGLQEKQTENIQQDTIGKTIDNQTKGIENLYRIKNLFEDVKNKGANTSYLQSLMRGVDMQNRILSDTMVDKINQEHFQSVLMQGQATSAMIASRYADREHQMNLKVALMNASAAVMSGHASMKQAMSSLREVAAKYGVSDKDRADFARASYDYLVQQTNESMSNEFSNLWTPGSYNVGSSMFGQVSSSYATGRHRQYNEWKKNKGRRR